MNPAPQLSKSGVAYRRAMGIPLDAPKMGRGGNFSITEEEAKAIWADVQRLTAAYPPRTINVCKEVATLHNVGQYVVQSMQCGRSWNHITGLKFKKYD